MYPPNTVCIYNEVNIVDPWQSNTFREINQCQITKGVSQVIEISENEKQDYEGSTVYVLKELHISRLHQTPLRGTSYQTPLWGTSHQTPLRGTPLRWTTYSLTCSHIFISTEHIHIQHSLLNLIPNEAGLTVKYSIISVYQLKTVTVEPLY